MIWFCFVCLVLATVGISLVHRDNNVLRANNARLVAENQRLSAEVATLRALVAETTELELDMEANNARQH